MNQKENYYAMLNGEKPEFIPCFGMYNKMVFMPGDVESVGFTTGGVDGFGVNWVLTIDGAIPEPNRYLFEDIADWKECVSFPDVDAVDYQAMAAKELDGVDRDESVIYVLGGAMGLFTRMNSMMGFENALISLVSDPDSCLELGEALADYQIKRMEKIIDAYQPDCIWVTDDVATARGLFMSPEVYRNVIKPSTKRIIDYILSRGVICNMHCCGKCEELIDDFVEMGCRQWNPAQTMNDLNGIQKKYGSKLLIEGGWDSSGRPGCVDATVEELCDEIERCTQTYGQYGNYILMPGMMNERGNGMLVGDDRLPAVFAKVAECVKL